MVIDLLSDDDHFSPEKSAGRAGLEKNDLEIEIFEQPSLKQRIELRLNSGVNTQVVTKPSVDNTSNTIVKNKEADEKFVDLTQDSDIPSQLEMDPKPQSSKNPHDDHNLDEQYTAYEFYGSAEDVFAMDSWQDEGYSHGSASFQTNPSVSEPQNTTALVGKSLFSMLNAKYGSTKPTANIRPEEDTVSLEETMPGDKSNANHKRKQHDQSNNSSETNDEGVTKKKVRKVNKDKLNDTSSVNKLVQKKTKANTATNNNILHWLQPNLDGEESLHSHHTLQPQVDVVKSYHMTTPAMLAISNSDEVSQSGFSHPLRAMQLQYIPIRPVPNTTYDIYLLVDKREKSNFLIYRGLLDRHVHVKETQLSVGDFVWIAKPSFLDMYSSEEEINKHTIVLDCICERKTIADLSASLVDGRFSEQKHRLQCTPMSRRYMIVEGESMNIQHTNHYAFHNNKNNNNGNGNNGNHNGNANQYGSGVSKEYLKSAVISSYAEHHMHILRSQDLDHTIQLLQHLTVQITARFQRLLQHINTSGNEEIAFQKFIDFQNLYKKQSNLLTFSDLFAYQLRQIHGCSVQSVYAMMKRFGTTAKLCQYLQSVPKHVAEHTIANLQKESEPPNYQKENSHPNSDSTSHSTSNNNSALGKINDSLARKIVNVYSQEY